MLTFTFPASGAETEDVLPDILSPSVEDDENDANGEEAIEVDVQGDIENILTAPETTSQHTVTFNANGGVISGAGTKEVTETEAYGDLPVATRAGCKFSGWYTELSTGKQVTSGTIVTAAADHTLYAHWTYVNGFAKQANGTYKYYKNGKALTGWQKIKANNGITYKYYFSSKGIMSTGWKKIKDKNGKTYKYYFGGANSGKMRTGWRKVSGKWYNFGVTGDGKMKTGKKTFEGMTHIFNKNGEWTGVSF
jgi:uncharacterized repeat protein (TIGR02543 family)